MRSIEGVSALVTGANRGIGLAFVEALAEHGARKIFAATRNAEAFAPLRERFGKLVVPLHFDLAEPASMAAVLSTASDVDLLISNAGRTLIGPFMDHDLVDVRHVFEVNMFGPLQLVTALMPGLRARAGGVIFVLSMAALLPALGAEAYSASKAGMMMLAHGLRTAAKADGVQVSLVYPGFIDTPMSDAFDVRKASPRQVAQRSLEGWMAGTTSIFPDLFAEMTRDALLQRMPNVLSEPNTLLREMVETFVAHPDAGR